MILITRAGDQEQGNCMSPIPCIANPTTLAVTPPTTLVVALALVMAVATMLLARYVRFLPMVTAYILAGILIGPHALGMIPSEQVVRDLTPLRDIALAVVLFTIGTQFEISVFRHLRPWLLRLGAWDTLGVAAVVGLSMWGMTGSVETAILTAIIALEIAPAATFLVLRETASSGTMTRLILNAVVVNNIFVIALFSLTWPVLRIAYHGGAWTMLLHGPAVIVGSIALGTIIGLAITVAEQKYHSDAERLLLLLGGILLTVGLSQLLDFQPFLIASLTAGIVVGNASAKAEQVRQLIERIDTPFYVIFFVLAGASLHLDYLLESTTALLAGGYILTRVVGRLAGCYLGARGRSLEPRIVRWLPASLLSHSAIAIALVGLLYQTFPGENSAFQQLQTVVLAAVAVYELAAPVLLKIALTVSGEVSVAHGTMRGQGIADIGAWKQVLHRLGESLGVRARSVPIDLAQANMEQIIVRDVHAIGVDQGYNKVLGFVGHSKFDCVPVVDAEGYYLGYISYYQIRNFAYDPSFSSLIIAGDMMSTGAEMVLGQDQPDDVADRFNRSNTSYLPVIRPAERDPTRRALVGLIEQQTLLRYILAHSAAEQARKKDESPQSPPPADAAPGQGP
ncbi:MAG: hypothetical protein BIFFINMI_01248 [Phycisphaerae bacterium]|nr:hypothetical protein [Phycisphaerae bacterium]